MIDYRHFWVMSHKDFDEGMEHEGWNDANVPADHAFISICCSPAFREKYFKRHNTVDEHWFKGEHDNVLNLDFDDITEPSKETEYGTAYGITDEQAKQILEFFEKNQDKRHWFIHCHAGKSRSMAVGNYLVNKWNKLHGGPGTWGRLHKLNGGILGQNMFVYNKLKDNDKDFS